MNYLSVGDMAQSYRLRHQSVSTKQQLDRLTQEMTSGVTTDPADAVSGDFSTLSGIERSLTRLEAFHTITTEAAQFASGLQLALAQVQTTAGNVAPGLLTAGSAQNEMQIKSVTAAAREGLSGVLSALNVRVADRYLLSGAATDQKPLPTAGDLMTSVSAAVAGQTTAAGIIGAVDAWFAAPGGGGGGYQDLAYGGSTAALSPFRTAEGETVQISLTAADAPIRDVLRGFVLATLVAGGALAGDVAGRGLLTQTAGAALVASGTTLTATMSDLGTAEAAIEASATRNASAKTTFETARSNILAIDPYATATALEAVQAQTKTIYTLTAQLSQLHLADYL